jgi:hypothetical protein
MVERDDIDAAIEARRELGGDDGRGLIGIVLLNAVYNR